MSRHRYPTEICRVFERTTAAKLQETLSSFKELENTEPVSNDENNTADKAQKEKQCKRKGGKSSELSKNASDGTRAKQATLKNLLGEALGYGPALSEHMILDAGLVPNTKVSKNSRLDNDAIQVLLHAVAKFEDWLQDVISGNKVPEGYILMQIKHLGKDHAPSESRSSCQVIVIVTYDDIPLSPSPPPHHKTKQEEEEEEKLA